MIRVGFNAYLLSSPHMRGWPRYTVNLLAALPAWGVRPVLYSINPIHEVHLHPLPAGSFDLVPSGPMKYLRWEQSWLPRRCRADGIDLLHSPINFGLPWRSHCPRVLTLHDAIDQVYNAPKSHWRSRLRLAALKSRFAAWSSRVRAHRIITVSEHAKNDLVRLLKVPEARIRVTPEAADPVFHKPLTLEQRDAVHSKWNLASRYVFYIGGWELRKNIPFLLKGFAAAQCGDVDLVLAGGREEQKADLVALAGELGIADRLRLLGFVPDEDLPALYANALAFVYPSEYEGFGLQLVEAMAVGCPVLAARATCLPEVLGSGGDTFALGEPGELAMQLRRLATDDAYRSDLASRSLARSADFTWARTAELTANVYRELVDRPNHA